MRWKIFQWMKLLFRHSSNSRKLSRQKFHNELACVFTAHDASKNADWNQQQLTDGGILANRNSANHPYCFLSNQKKVQILAFLHVIRQRNVSCPLPVRHPLYMDTPFWWTVCFVPGKRKPYIFSKFNPLNTDSPLIPTNGVWLFRLSRFGGGEEVSAHDSRALSLSNSFLLAWVAMFNDLLSRFSKAREIKWSGFLKTKGSTLLKRKRIISFALNGWKLGYLWLVESRKECSLAWSVARLRFHE